MARRKDDWLEFRDVTVSRETDKAIEVVIEEKKYWIPKSQIHDDSEVYEKGTEGILIISEWIATEKGLT